MNLQWLSLCFLFLYLILAGCSTSHLTADRDQAFKSYEEQNYQKACSQFEILATKIPKDTLLWFKYGNACAKAQYPQKAISAYQNALLRDPSLVKAWYNMGIIQMQAALNTFIEMEPFVEQESAIGQRGQKMKEGLLLLLEDSDS